MAGVTISPKAFFFWLGCFYVLAGLHIAFLLDTNNPVGPESMLHPSLTFEMVGAQLENANFFRFFNIPVLSLIVSVIWVFTVYFNGLLLLRKLGQTGRHFDTHSLAFGLGTVAIGIAILIVGLVKVSLISYVLAPLLLISAVGTFWRERKLLRRENKVRFSRPKLWILGGLIFLSIFAVALVPPTQSDGVRYHLGAPQEFIKNDRIAYLPLNAFSNFPFLPEMHFLYALLFKSPEASQIMHFCFFLATAAMIGCTARMLSLLIFKRTNFSAVFIPVAIYLFTPQNLILAVWPFTDHFVAFYLVAAIYTLLRFMISRSVLHFIIHSFMIAGLLGVKYTMLPYAGIFYLIVLCTAFKKPRMPVKIISVGVAIVFFLGGAWYFKNLFLTNNPVYPFANSLFQSGEWSAQNAKIYSEKAGLKGSPKTLANLFISPYKSLIEWNRYENHNPGITGWICWSAIFISLIFVIKFPSRLRFPVLILAGSAVLFWIMWFYSYQGNRLLLPFFAVSLPLTAVIIGKVPALKKPYAVVPLVYATGYGYFWAVQWLYAFTVLTPGPLTYLSGTLSPATYSAQALNYFTAYEYLNKNTKPDEKVLLIGEHRIYGARFSAVWSDWFDTPALLHILRENKIRSLPALLEYCRSKNIRYIFINNAELRPQLVSDFQPRFSPEEWQIFTELIALKDSADLQKTILRPDSLILRLW